MDLLRKISLYVAMGLCVILTACSIQNEQNPAKEAQGSNPKIVATSMAVVQIMDKLNIDLVGVPQSAVEELPERYRNVRGIGSPMNPDIEIIASLHPDYIFAPAALIADLKPKFDQIGVEYGFVNLSNVEGMYASIRDLGELLDREKEAAELVSEYEKFMTEFNQRIRSKEQKTVLILMGLPGSYVVATDRSYVGSLVKLAGGKNVYESATGEPFVNVNIEDMMKKDPDIILRTAHAMPEDVMKMFAKDFEENNNWKHFRAVRSNQVFDLDYEKFGMSAKFNYPEALADLEEILYE